MPQKGKCSNYAGCLLAYRNETIAIPDGEEFICPECRQPLVAVSAETKVTPKLVPLLIVGGIVLLVIFGTIAVLDQARRLRRDPAMATPSPAAATTAVSPATDRAAAVAPTPATGAGESLAPPAGTGGTASAAAGIPGPGDAATPALTAPTRTATPNLDPAAAENSRVKAEVLKRIDLMPTISAENKDKLYFSVERARRMGRVITIPFEKGKTTMSPSEAEALKTEVNSPEVQAIMQDPTCVFVILGYADIKGDEKMNLRISLDRAQNVLATLRDKCGVINVMHSVGMGGSTLFDEAGVEKNRVAEVWAVLP